MLKQETINKLAALAKVKPEELLTAIKAEAETDLAIDDKLTVYTDDELQTLKSNSYKEGKKAGVEMEVDDLKKELNLEFQGKTVKGLIEAHKSHVLKEAKIEPAEKVKELEGKIQTLQLTVKEKEQALADKESEVETTIVNSELYKYIPAPKEDGPAFDQEDIIYKMKREGYEFKRDGNSVKPYLKGEKLTDKLGNDLQVKDVVTTFLKEKKLIAEATPPIGGRGGDDKRPPSKAGKLSELKKEFTDQGKSLIGLEFSQAVEAAVKENKEFDLTA